MTRALLLAGLASATLLSGCALPGNARLTPGCEADRAIGYVGQRYSAQIGETIRKKTFSRAARMIAPDTAVTQDFRSDRVNIATDDTGIVTRIYCG